MALRNLLVFPCQPLPAGVAMWGFVLEKKPQMHRIGWEGEEEMCVCKLYMKLKSDDQ